MVPELLEFIVNWRTGLVVLLVFGFAPGALLRLIVLAFRRDDPRRSEMLAELHRVPRLERPIWVVEQLEVALFEGIGERVLGVATGRIIYRWHLESGVRRNRKHPSFQIPDEHEKQAIKPGVVVKLMFEIDDMRGRHLWGEGMWVEVLAVQKRRVVGRLLNQPVAIPRLAYGDQVKFKRHHIIDIDWDSEHLREDSEADPEPRIMHLCQACNTYGHPELTEPGPTTEAPDADSTGDST
jgi:hypothetical protein